MLQAKYNELSTVHIIAMQPSSDKAVACNLKLVSGDPHGYHVLKTAFTAILFVNLHCLR